MSGAAIANAESNKRLSMKCKLASRFDHPASAGGYWLLSTDHGQLTIPLLLALLTGELPEILLDHIAIMRGEILADLLQGFLALFRRQIAPATLAADVLAGHIAGAL